MFKFKGISSNDMQVVIEEEEHFVARAAKRYETIEIEGRDGAIFNELGYSYVERPIYVQCLNPNKIDDILAWLDGEGEFEYKGRKTTARFYSQLEPQRETVIRIIDTTFIRDPFWIKLEDEFVEVKGDKEKTVEDENLNLKGTIPVKFKEFKVSGNSKQETRSGKNLLPYPYNSVQNFIIQDLGDGRIILNGTQETNTSITIKTFNLKAGTYKFLFNTAALPNNSYFFIRNQSTSEVLKTNIKTNTTFSLEEDILTRLDLVLVAGSYSDYKLDLMILEATEEDESFEQYGAMPSPEYPSEIQNVEGDVNVTVANKEKTEQQTVTFPLAENQKLMLGDYLASDGIHHVRKQIELDGTEGWVLYTGYANNAEKGYCYYLNITDCKIVKDTSISTHFKNVFGAYQESTGYVGAFSDNLNVKNKYFISDKETLEQFKTYLAQQKQAGTPVIIEYELAEEEIEPYTEEQQEAYNQLKQLTAYEEETNIYSTNSTSPIFKVTYIEETTEKIENEGNIYSRPMLRLEKTSYNNVDIEIAGTRFQYNFNDEEYVEIDCEEKTALYEGLNRNRKLEIGYEFPKLLPGENDIKMHEGDCIIKAKRKDRWL